MATENARGSHTWTLKSLEDNLQPFLTAHPERQTLVRGALDLIAHDPYALALTYFGSPDYPEQIYCYEIPDSKIEIAFGVAALSDDALVLVTVIDWDDPH